LGCVGVYFGESRTISFQERTPPQVGV